MKNICLILSAILFFGLQAYSQQYIPMPTSDAVWSYTLTQKGSSSYETIKFILTMKGGDTVINSKTWKKVMMRYVYDTAGHYTDIAEESDHFYAGLREDNKQVYVWFPDDNSPISCASSKDRLLYDFNLGIGDTIPDPSIRGTDGIKVIAGIDSILIGSKYHRRYLLKNPYNPTISLIEGVGSAEGLFYYRSIMYSIPSFKCFSHQQVLYPGDPSICHYIYEYGTPTSVSGVQNNEEVKIYRNPAYDQLTISAKDAVSITLHDNTGRVLEARETVNGLLKLDMSGYATGIYFIELVGKNRECICYRKLLKF